MVTSKPAWDTQQELKKKKERKKKGKSYGKMLLKCEFTRLEGKMAKQSSVENDYTVCCFSPVDVSGRCVVP